MKVFKQRHFIVKVSTLYIVSMNLRLLITYKLYTHHNIIDILNYLGWYFQEQKL